MGLSFLRPTVNSADVFSWQGWSQHQDSRVTEATAPLVLASGVRTKYVNNSGAVDIQRLPTEALGPFWDTATNNIIPVAAFDTYDLRIGLVAEGYGGTAGYLTVELDIGAPIGSILSETTRLLKAGAAQSITRAFPVFVGSTFLANGGEIYLTYNGTGTCSIHSTTMMVERKSKQWT